MSRLAYARIFLNFMRRVLELFVELTRRAGDENPAGDAAFAVFDPFDDAGGLAALGAVGALGGVHYFLAVCGLCNLGHIFSENLFYTRMEKLSFGPRMVAQFAVRLWYEREQGRLCEHKREINFGWPASPGVAGG